MPTVAFRVTRSRRAFVNAPQVRKVMEAAMDSKAAPHFVEEFDKRVANWKHKPTFQTKKQDTASAIIRLIAPAKNAAGKIYAYVTLGTPEHDIPLSPKSAGWLAFMWGGPGSYKAKTGPGGKFGGSGTVSGGSMTFAKQVHHPGNAPRNFEGDIAKKEKRWFFRTMDAAWKRAIESMSK